MSGSAAPRLPDKASIKRMFPKGKQAWINGLADAIPDICRKYNVTTAERWRQMMAQFAAETDGLALANMRENMNYSAKRIMEVFDYRIRLAQRSNPRFRGKSLVEIAGLLAAEPPLLAETVYGGRKELGNSRPGDGFLFIGRGLPQTTGREWYQKLSDAMGVDFISSPELLESPQHGVEAAFCEWDLMGLNQLADTGNVTAVSKRLNGGTNGLARRRSEYRRACVIWPEDWELPSGDVKSVQVKSSPVQSAPVDHVPVSIPEDNQVPRYAEHDPAKPIHPETTIGHEAAKSKSVWVIVLGFVSYFMDGVRWVFDQIAWLFGLIPETSTEVDSVMTPLKSLGGLLSVNVAAISTAVVVGCAGIVIFRHARDKKLKSDAKRKLALSEGNTA